MDAYKLQITKQSPSVLPIGKFIYHKARKETKPEETTVATTHHKQPSKTTNGQV